MITLARAFSLCSLVAVMPAYAETKVEICKSYIVAPGDTLRQVARMFYNGNSSLYTLIYEANRSVIGPNPHAIRVGTKLAIPCKAGMTEPKARKAAPAKPAAPVVTAPEPETTEASELARAHALAEEMWGGVKGTPIRILTANGYPPYTDESLPGGGLFTQLVETAIFRANPDQPYTLTFINDWQAHLDALLPTDAYDLSFPWIRPACETPELLSAGELDHCRNFVFSTHHHDIVEGFFAASDSELLQASDYKAYQNTRICRPEAMTTGFLENQGLTAYTTTLSRPPEALDCFEALAADKVDLVAVDIALGQAILKEMGLSGAFGFNPQLTQKATLHVIAPKANAQAVEMLKLLDEGALAMNSTGEWQDIIGSGSSD